MTQNGEAAFSCMLRLTPDANQATVSALRSILNGNHESDLHAVVQVTDYKTVAICTTMVAVAESTFDDGWLKSLWAVFVEPGWTQPENWPWSDDWSKRQNKPRHAPNDFVLGYFLGLLEASSEQTPPEFCDELVARFPLAVKRVVSASDLMRYEGPPFGRSSDSDWRDWKHRVEEQLKKMSGRIGDCRWRSLLRSVFEQLPPPVTFKDPRYGGPYPPRLGSPAEHVIDCLRWITNKMLKPYEGLHAVTVGDMHKPAFPYRVV